MENENQSVSDANNSTSGELENQKKDVVQYDTYRKAIGEVKSLKAKLQEIELKEQEREQQALAEQGKYKEALEAEKQKRKSYEEAKSAKDKAFAKRVFIKELESLAVSMGAKKEAIEDIVMVGDWSGVEIDDEFNVNADQLKTAITNLSKAKPYYFDNTLLTIKDVSKVGFHDNTNNKSSSELSVEEIKKRLRSL